MNEDLHGYIDALNQGITEEYIFTRKISEYVDVAKLWDDFQSYNFFFIRNNTQYVGTVHDAYSDLHWYILPNYRGKGYLTKALKTAILLYIFKNRDSQSISITIQSIGKENYKKSRAVAERLGFKSVNNSAVFFKLSSIDFNNEDENLCENNNLITEERLEKLREKIETATKVLSKISDEMLMTYSDNELSLIVDKVKDYKYRIEDIWSNNKY